MKWQTAVMMCVVSTALAGASKAADWPQWRGPLRDGICRETGLLKAWPADGPPLLWQMKGLGMGYSSVSVVGDTLYTMGDLQPEGQPKRQYLLAIDLKRHAVRWQAEVGPPHRDGSRCTPTVDGDRVYALGTSADLVCVSAADGTVLWKKNLEHDFGGRMMSGWRWSESPLVDGGKLLCTPGAKDAVMVALNKQTGETIWRAAMPNIGGNGKDGAGYSSIVVSEACGVRQYVQLLGRGAIGVDAATGKFLWGYNRVANGTANITTPVTQGDYVFVTTDYNTGSAVLKLKKAGDSVTAEEVCWLDANKFQNHHGGVVLVDGYVYGGSKKSGGPPTCIELKTGKVVWQVPAPAGGSAAYLYADGRFIVRYDKGPVTLAEASPAGHRVVGKFTPVKDHGPAWAHPVVAGGRLFLRHANTLACYDLRRH